MAYTATVWSTGDTITEALANHWEGQYAEVKTELAKAAAGDLAVHGANVTTVVADPAIATAYALTGSLTEHVSWITKAIKALKGVAGNWYDAASATIETIWGKFNATTGHGHSGAADDGPVLPTYLRYYSASDNLIHSYDAGTSTGAGTYTKLKTIFNPCGGTYRVKFDLESGGGDTVHGRIYRNGVALGTARWTSSRSYQTYSEDLVFMPGDTIELWGYAEGTDTCWVRNLRVYGTTATVAFVNS